MAVLGSCRPAAGRIERLMRRYGIRAIMAPPRRVRTSDSRSNLPVPNLNARAFSRKIIGWVMRRHRRALGQSKRRSPSRRNYVRTLLVFVILDCDVLLVLQNIAYVVRCQRVRTVLIRTTFFRG
jgi:hypothetical protein